MQKLTTEQFIAKAKAKHGDKYDYANVVYVNNRTPVVICCPKHGYFEQKPHTHLRGHGCPKCANNVKYTEITFIKRAKEIHGDIYDYSKTHYNNYVDKVIITCKKHGDFLQIPGVHLQGSGCPKCAIEKSRLTKEEFVTRANKLFGDKYDYSLVEYKNNRTKVKIICPVHGLFEQQPGCHLQGWGCIKCANEQQLDTLDNFIARAKAVHGTKYTYEHAKYIGSYKPITITCPKHGDFTQRASAHLDGEGCPSCKESKGEMQIAQYLDSTGVQYKRQYSFKDCRYKSKLYFDFAILETDGTLRCLIEYQGLQHYKFVPSLHRTQEGFMCSQERDEIKRKYCAEHDILLLEVSYKQDLSEFFEEAGGLLWN